MIPAPISRRTFNAQELVNRFPPRLHCQNKKAVHRIACPPDSMHSGQITFSRWARMPLPAVMNGAAVPPGVELRHGYFGYEPPLAGHNRVEWYVNFAHEHLFCAYGGPLFAQDEMQVSEHPALGSLREALLKSDVSPLTVQDGEPTPVLVMGVERRCRVATEPNPEQGRPHGLYGNAFSQATAEAVAKATQAIVPPTLTNLIAMEAPPGGSGNYTRRQIEFVLATAFTGFSAARIESARETAETPEVAVHTGYWGCGAYGGNRVLMALLQLLAARLARVDRLVFHAGREVGALDFEDAERFIDDLTSGGPPPRNLSDLIAQIESMDWPWGGSDGN